MESTNERNLFDLQIDHNGSAFLKEAAKWAKFLGIMGFIFCAIFALIGLFAGSVMSAAFSSMGPAGASFKGGGVLVSILYVGLAVLCFFPYLYLYNFAGKMQTALRANDQDQLNLSFRNLRSYLRFVGILTIIGLCFMALCIIIGIIGAATTMR